MKLREVFFKIKSIRENRQSGMDRGLVNGQVLWITITAWNYYRSGKASVGQIPIPSRSLKGVDLPILL
jgi:hypothetical protein